jgi:hypothetical protein
MKRTATFATRPQSIVSFDRHRMAQAIRHTRAERAVLLAAAAFLLLSSTVVAAAKLDVTGTVTDDTGKPLAGSVVRAWHFGRQNKAEDVREAISGVDGVYRLMSLEPRMAAVMATAKGRAIDLHEVLVQSGMTPVDFRLKPGRTIRIRVVDAMMRPIAKARVVMCWYREDESSVDLEHVSRTADEHGLWEWREAPSAGQLSARLSVPGRMNANISIVPQTSEYVVQSPPMLVISGNVIDHETKRPIWQFRVLPGAGSEPAEAYWRHHERLAGADGQFQYRETRSFGGTQFLRIEADDYEPATSRAVKSDEGSVALKFELVRGQNLDAVVLTPDGHPAVNAKIAVAGLGAHILIKNGDLDARSNADCTVTDASGHFHFPPQPAGFCIAITHSTGYVFYRPGVRALRRTINLGPWSRVEGTYRILGRPIENLPIAISAGLPRLYEDRDRVGASWNTTTGPNGHLVFDRVPAVRGAVDRPLNMTFNDGWFIPGGTSHMASTCGLPATFPPGKTLHIDIGRKGRSVVGKLRPPANFKKPVFWNFALLNADSEPDSESKEKKQRLRFNATVSRDGDFRIDEMPPGQYSLNITFSRFVVGYLDETSFSIPEKDATWSAKPIDLGVLTLHDE